MTALTRIGGHLAEAYVNWGRWVAKCDVCPWAATLQRATRHIECPLCGTVTEILWPSDDMVAGIGRLLTMRPNPQTRNWLPGETLRDLMWENGAHGIFDGLSEALGATPGAALLGVDDNRIRLDRLPAIGQDIRKELT